MDEKQQNLTEDIYKKAGFPVSPYNHPKGDKKPGLAEEKSLYIRRRNEIAAEIYAQQKGIARPTLLEEAHQTAGNDVERTSERHYLTNGQREGWSEDQERETVRKLTFAQRQLRNAHVDAILHQRYASSPKAQSFEEKNERKQGTFREAMELTRRDIENIQTQVAQALGKGASWAL